MKKPIVSKPDLRLGIWAENGNIEAPSSEKVEEGWVVEKPLNEQMNWIQNRQDRMLHYLNQRGLPEWDSNTTYPTEAFCVRSGTVYQAVSTNTDSDPTLNPDIWKIAFVNLEDFQTYAETILKIEHEDGFLKHYVKKSSPEVDVPIKGVSYNNKVNDSGLSFKQETPIIKRSGYVVAEFSGGSKPKDVVTHEQLALAIQNYKIGDVYITTVSGNPNERLGYGTWERFAQGKTLVGFAETVSNKVPEWVKTAGSEFGEYEHKLTVEEMPSHTHGGVRPPRGNVDADLNGRDDTVYGGSIDTQPTGGDKPHNNVQPSIVVYFWMRIA